MALVDVSGAVLNSYEYDVFGAVRSSTGSTANAFTFTGEQTDASTGFEYLRARYYDSASGRFISRDPLGGGYPYGANNPARMFDPKGLYPICGAPSEYGPLPCFDSTEVNLPAEPPLACSGPGGTGHCVYPDASVYLAGGSENIYEGEAEFWIPAEDGNGTPTGGSGGGGGGGGAWGSSSGGGGCGLVCVRLNLFGDSLQAAMNPVQACGGLAASAASTASIVAPGSDPVGIALSSAQATLAAAQGDELGAALNAVSAAGGFASGALDATIVGIPAGAVVGAATSAPSLIYSVAQCIP